MKVVIKEPGKDAVVKDIPNTLKSLQETVDGLITVVPHPTIPGVDIVCNDEAILLQMLPNIAYTLSQHPIVLFGTVIFVAVNGESFASLTDKNCTDIINWLEG